jgi:hypothetical protein
VYFAAFSVAVLEKVVTLAVTGNTISGRVIPCQRVPEFHWYRLLLTGSRWDKLWPIHRRTKPIFCVFPVFSVTVWIGVVTLAVTGNTISGLLFWRQRVPEIKGH